MIMKPHQQVSIVLMNQAKLWAEMKKRRAMIEKIANKGVETEAEHQLAKAICCTLIAGFFCDDQLKKNPDQYFGEN